MYSCARSSRASGSRRYDADYSSTLCAVQLSPTTFYYIYTSTSPTWCLTATTPFEERSVASSSWTDLKKSEFLLLVATAKGRASQLTQQQLFAGTSPSQTESGFSASHAIYTLLCELVVALLLNCCNNILAKTFPINSPPMKPWNRVADSNKLFRINLNFKVIFIIHHIYCSRWVEGWRSEYNIATGFPGQLTTAPSHVKDC